jgi:hypothetical protein
MPHLTTLGVSSFLWCCSSSRLPLSTQGFHASASGLHAPVINRVPTAFLCLTICRIIILGFILLHLEIFSVIFYSLFFFFSLVFFVGLFSFLFIFFFTKFSLFLFTTYGLVGLLNLRNFVFYYGLFW